MNSMKDSLYSSVNNATRAFTINTETTSRQPKLQGQPKVKAQPPLKSQYSYQSLNYTKPRRLNHYQSVMYSRDWRLALRTPPTYRIGNRTLRFNYHMALILAGVFIFIILLYYMRSTATTTDADWLKNYASSTSNHRNNISNRGAVMMQQHTSNSNSAGNSNSITGSYNYTYPITAPLLNRLGSITYRIGMVADLDVRGKVIVNSDKQMQSVPLWRSYLKKGYLTYIHSKDAVTFKWDTDNVELESSFALRDRGLELSELVTFNGKLLTFDDRTGLVYELNNDKILPWIILMDGNGYNTKGFKSEWATVKDELLYVGSMGKEWTTASGDYENDNPMFVKIITPTGIVRAIDWSANYKRLRQQAADITWPGYMIHESGVWSAKHKKWFFLPRRCSKEKYNETQDEHMGCNLLITADEDFNRIESIPLDATNIRPTHGISSFKFIPNTDDHIIVAIRSEELNGNTSTFITAFNINGKILLPEQIVDNHIKFEGFEFI